MSLIRLYKDWFEAREYFAKPRMKVQTFKETVHKKIGKYSLPLWLTFGYYQRDLMWEFRWDDIRFELPPCIDITLFGTVFRISLAAPKTRNPLSLEDLYWEGILYHTVKHLPFEECIKVIGIWKTKNRLFVGTEPEYINLKHAREYYRIVEQLIEESYEID